MPMKDFAESIAMLCPRCGATELIPDTRDIPYTYKGVSATIPAVSGNYCPTCGEGVLNREHGDRYSKLVGQFRHRITYEIREKS